jgi:hypothetical protein
MNIFLQPLSNYGKKGGEIIDAKNSSLATRIITDVYGKL